MALAESDLDRLPDPILSKILSMTGSYRFAVNCSVISKRWKFLYTHVPCLQLRAQEVMGNTKSIRLFKKARRSEEIFYEQIVNTALFRHRGQIDSIHITAFDIHTLRSWLEFTVSQNVKKLHLDIDFIWSNTQDNVHDEQDYTRLQKLFTGSSWDYCNVTFSFKASPSLERCFSAFSAFRNLTSCTLHFINLKTWQSPSNLLCWFPAITAFSLDHCEFPFLRPLQIAASSLKFISLKKSYSVVLKSKNVCITVDCPNLLEMCVDYEDLELVKFVSSPPLKLRVTEVSCLSPIFWKNLVKLGNYKSLALELVTGNKKDKMKTATWGDCFYEADKLEKVYMETPLFGKQEQWFVCQILDKCPKLSRITVSVKLLLDESLHKKFMPMATKVRRASKNVSLWIHVASPKRSWKIF